jgi:hypothetical protein
MENQTHNEGSNSRDIFITVNVLFLLGLGYTMSRLQRDGIINNWAERRCELPVMTAAYFFKPESDPRSKMEFSNDNFMFCMKSYVDTFMSVLSMPINQSINTHIDTANIVSSAMNSVRGITHTIYSQFTSYLDGFSQQFNSTIFQLSRIFQHVIMSFEKLNTIVIGFLYSGLSIFRGILNGIQFVAKVVMIIALIIVVLLFILFFFLFPTIPLIIATLLVIGTIYDYLSPVFALGAAVNVSGTISAFCFAGDTQIQLKNNELKSARDIKSGDELSDGGRVTEVIQMYGDASPLYNLNGILVSGSHLVKGTDGVWKLVETDERAKKSPVRSSVLYCFNTTTNNIPVYSPVTEMTIMFRDWEEIGNNDVYGQYKWNSIVSMHLNSHKSLTKWVHLLRLESEVGVLGGDVLVKTPKGFVPIRTITLLSKIEGMDGKENTVLGIITSTTEELVSDTSTANLYEFRNGIWSQSDSKQKQICYSERAGFSLIVESGEFIIWDDSMEKERLVRDFTEIGYRSIHKTYPFVSSRLRITDKII